MSNKRFYALEIWLAEQVFVKKEKLRNVNFVQDGDNYLVLLNRKGSDVLCVTVSGAWSGSRNVRKIQTDQEGQSYIENDNNRFYLSRKDKANGRMINNIQSLRTRPTFLYNAITLHGRGGDILEENREKIRYNNSRASNELSGLEAILKSCFVEDLELFYTNAIIGENYYHLRGVGGQWTSNYYDVRFYLEGRSKFGLLPNFAKGVGITVVIHRKNTLCTEIEEFVRVGSKVSLVEMFEKARVFYKEDKITLGIGHPDPYIRRRV